MRFVVTTGIAVLALSSISALGAEALFKYKGKQYTVNDVDPKVQLRLFDAEVNYFGMQSRIVDEAVLDIYFTDLAKKQKKSVDQIRQEKLKVAEPSEKELKAFYEENKQRIPYPYDQVKSELTRYVKEKKATEARTKLVETVKKQGQYALLLKEPVAPEIKINTEEFASRGKNDAKVTVVEFADYKCSHCREASKAFKKLFAKYDNRVKFVFIDFPIINGSEKIAEGAFCARKQDKYWEYHTLAFEQQGKLDNPVELAKKVKLDDKKFKECVDKKEGQSVVQKGKAEGERLGVSGTPTIYINGRKVVSGYTYEAIAGELDKALKAAHAS